MVKENHYKDIESQIRKQLAIAMESEVWRAKVTSDSLSDRLCELNKTIALDKIKRMLNKLPKNYHASPELMRRYEIFMYYENQLGCMKD